MKINQDNTKYINVVGSPCSGTGAIFDYLYGRGDLYDPLFGEEYLLPSLPNGLLNLLATIEKASDPSITEYSLKKFKYLTNYLMKYWSSKKNNEKLNSNIKIFEIAVEQFIKDITYIDYPMRLLSQELSKSFVENTISKFRRKIGVSASNPQTRLTVSKTNFLEAVHKLHNSMFNTNAENKKIILNRGCSIWCLKESSKFFLDGKIVVVNRDPRDQFVELKSYKQAHSVDGFVDWYRESRNRLDLVNDSNILFINFEDFVIKNDKYKKILCDHISINEITSTYDPELSKKNVGKFINNLDKNEILKIEKNLNEYIYFD